MSIDGIDGSDKLFSTTGRLTSEMVTLSLHVALPISGCSFSETFSPVCRDVPLKPADFARRSEEHTSELQSRLHLVCRLLLEKKNSEKVRTESNHVPSIDLPADADETRDRKRGQQQHD